MSGKTTDLTVLELRKQLLVVESELNRAHLVTECREVMKSVDHLSAQVAAAVSMAESAAKIGTSFAGFFQGFGGRNKTSNDQNPSWFSTVFDGVRAGFSLWKKLRTDRRETE